MKLILKESSASAWLLLLGTCFLSSCTDKKQKTFCHKSEYPKSIQKGIRQAVTTFNGYVHATKESFEDMCVNGGAQLTSVIVHQGLTVNGALQGESLKVYGNFCVNGSVNLLNSEIQCSSTISGFLSASQCLFKDILIATKRMQFYESSIDSITVKADKTNDPQFIELDNTTIHGSITFEKGEGKVFLNNGSRVKGKVVGGELIY